MAHGRDQGRLDDLVTEVERETGVPVDAVRADLASLREVDAQRRPCSLGTTCWTSW